MESQVIELPESHRAVEISPEKWAWPPCIPFDVDGRKMFCGDVFRAAGTTFVRLVAWKHLGDFEARRYVEGTYFTAAEWAESQA
jgi:hypothetical protein